MTCRILMVVWCLVLGSSSLAAQQAALRPRPSSLFEPAAAVTADSVRLAPTYWKEGAVVGGVIVGALGAVAMTGLCEMDESANGCNVGLAAIGGAAIGFLIGAIPGALIGGQIHKSE